MNFRKFIKKKIYKNKLVHIFLLALLVISFANFSYNYSTGLTFFKSIGNFVDDNLLYSRIYESNIHNNEVVIVKIDERTLDELGQLGDIKTLSFTKSDHAKVVENLFEKYKISTLGVDIIYANNSTDEDENILKKTFENYKDKIVIASMGDNSLTPICKYSGIQHGSVLIEPQPRIRKVGIDFPNYTLENKCKDSEIYEGNKNGISLFPIEIYKKYLLQDKNILKAKQNLIKLENDLQTQKNENDGYLFINFSNNGENNKDTMGFKSYSFIDIYNNRQFDKVTGEKIDLEGKIVLIGEAGTSFKDEFLTPIDLKTRMPGVEIHANIINTMLYDSYLNHITEMIKVLLSILFVLIIMFFMLKTNNVLNVILLFIYFFLQIVIGLQLFSNLYIYPVSFFIYLGIITFIVVYIYKYKTSEKNKTFLRKAFNMYLSSHMVDKIIKNPDELKLTGKKGELTMFFSDIAGFTTISESMKSEELFILLNEYLSEMTKILIKNDGTLDKYIGDAVMGFFNAPISVKHPDKKACITALEQMKRLKELNKGWKKRGFPKIDIRIGINSGETMHGNLGAEGERINYTVLGDSVNLAARLEGINKYYGTEICIGEHTYERVKKDFLIREMDTIKVKGKTKGVKIYELIGKKGHKFDNHILTNYESGLRDYYHGHYKKAIHEFEKNKGKDKISEVMIDRCEKVIKGEVKVVNGVYTMTSK